jgi:hypothetical protein
MIQFSKDRTKWNKVSRHHRCPICGKPDWCLFTGPADSPDAVICARVESQKIVGTKGAGWLHRLRHYDDQRRDRPRQVRVEVEAQPSINIEALAAEYYSALGPYTLGLLSATLGVSKPSLSRLGVGWSARDRAFSFPMRDGDGNVIGIRLRCADGRKWAVKGSRQGLFIPERLNNCADRLLICEGPTDTAALLDLGFDAIGRPSCNGGNRCVLGLVLSDGRLVPREVVIVADSDEPGQRGAWKLATTLVSYVGRVRIIEPPDGVKDARQWVQSGATRYDVEAAIDEAPALGFTYTVTGVSR